MNSYEFSYVQAGPCAYPQIKEQYTLEFSKVDDLEEEDGWGWDWKQSNLVQFLLCRLRQDGGAALKPSDIRLTTLAGEKLPARFLANGATACQFEVLAQPRVAPVFAKRGSPEEEGFMYAVSWPGWYKVGWAKDPLQRMANGFWDNLHPEGPNGLCGKLGPDSFEIIGIWGLATRGDDATFRKKFPGDVGEFFKAYRCRPLDWVTKNFSLHESCRGAFGLVRPPTELPKPNEHDKSKNKRSCCSGFQHFCKKCGETFVDGRKWKRHRDAAGPTCHKKHIAKWIGFLEGEQPTKKKRI